MNPKLKQESKSDSAASAELTKKSSPDIKKNPHQEKILSVQYSNVKSKFPSKEQGDTVKEKPTRHKTFTRRRNQPGDKLLTNKLSVFCNFDPLRSLHFLLKELCIRMEKILPRHPDILHLILEINDTMKRIPSEKPYKTVSSLIKSSTASVQTPPTLYKEDTQTFKKLIEASTAKLEVSCRQLEVVWFSVQKSKELTEKELQEAKVNVNLLRKRVEELEDELGEVSDIKIQQLEEEKVELKKSITKPDRTPFRVLTGLIVTTPCLFMFLLLKFVYL